MFDVGRVCVKIAGRDAGKKCVVVDVKDSRVLIDGQTRRKLCNPRHLEPTAQVLDIKAGASFEAVKKAFGSINVEVTQTKAKKSVERPKRVKKKKETPVPLKPVKSKQPGVAKKEVPLAETNEPQQEEKASASAKAESLPEKKPKPVVKKAIKKTAKD